MISSVEFVNKKKWRVLFVPWKECETGIVVKCALLFALSDFKEFYIDLWKAMFKRREKNLAHDKKFLRSAQNL